MGDALKRRWLAYTALCLLAGSSWLGDEWRAPVLPGVAGLAVHMGVLALIFWAVERGRGKIQVRYQSGGRLPLALWGAVLLAAPQLTATAAGGALSSFTVVLIFALVPLMLIMLRAQARARFGVEQSPLAGVPAALAGLAGAAFLLPSSLPASLRGWIWLVVLLGCALSSAVSAIKLHGLLAGMDVWRGSAILCGAAALTAGAGSWLGWRGPIAWDPVNALFEGARCLFVDGPVVLLTVWLLRDLPPVRVGARYLIIPLVTIVEGFVALRPEVTWTFAVGLVLMIGGCVGLLRGEREEPTAEL